ncbi:uncharacterized protein LOC120655578 [Panicum virgatum]|nr:uncharacterized protein LOC120655578 [Panicum virgatum]
MSSTASLLVLALAGLLLVTFPGLCAGTAAAHHRPNGNQCHPSGSLEGPSTGHICGECCKPGHLYPKYQCSPPVTKNTRAVMTLNNFEEGGDGGDPSECDGKYHYNTERVVALSTGWYNHGKRCGKNIRISAKGRSVLAKVVDECDSLHGCDKPHAFQPPCEPNIVDASQAVWDALDITGDEVGDYPITWTDASQMENVAHSLQIGRDLRINAHSSLTSYNNTIIKMSSTASLLVLALAGLLLVTFPGLCAGTAAAHHRPNGNQCHPSGSLEGPSTGHICGECCKPGHLYPKYQCSPPVTKNTRAVMTLNNFEEGGDGGDPSECDGKYHYNTERVVALSTGWYNHGKRCGKNIRISAKGRSVLANVVDECDSLHGCDKPHAFQPPCEPNIVDASQAVWDALDITGDEVGDYPITWTDA